MKFIFSIVTTLLLSLSASANVTGYINFGGYLNCDIKNNTPYNVLINAIRYDVIYTNGASDYLIVRCDYNCGLYPGHSNRFTGPRNSSNIAQASCRPNFSY
ncbi:MAG: hypothetical protein AB8E15_01785 [Bdellovibrionales bacterium]